MNITYILTVAVSILGGFTFAILWGQKIVKKDQTPYMPTDIKDAERKRDLIINRIKLSKAPEEFISIKWHIGKYADEFKDKLCKDDLNDNLTLITIYYSIFTK